MPNHFQIPNCGTCEVRCSSIFNELGKDELHIIDDIKDASLCRKGQTIFHEGSNPKGLFIVYQGKVKISKLGSNAREQIVRLAKPGDILGYRSLLGNEKYYASAVALEDSVICFIPRQQLFMLLEKYPNLSVKLLKLLSHDLASAERKMVEMVQKPVRERVAEALLLLKEVYGFEEDNKTLNIILTREDIGNLVGTTTETTIRILSDLKEENIIVFDKKKIVIQNLPKLVRESHIND
ncbi:MAG: Crp/Fnr family transcriptional regulator [Bacteroidia bacterium]